MKKLTLCLLLGMTAIHAAPIQFDFLFEDSVTGARAEGYIVFEETLLVNPTLNDGGPLPNGGPPGDDGFYEIPGPAVLDLAFTVSGSQGSNGDYGIDDYASVVLFTNGGTLNLNGELVGQPTDDDPWGTVQGGSAGDFNLFSNDINPPGSADAYASANGDGGPGGGIIPSGCFFFELCTATDNMFLVSMRGSPGAVQSVPASSDFGLLLLILSSLMVGFLYFRK